MWLYIFNWILILSIWSWMYSNRSFWHVLVLSFWTFLSFCMLAFVGFLLLSKDAFYLVFSQLRVTHMELNIWFLFWLVCTMLLLPCEWWLSFHIHQWEYVFLNFPEEYKICYSYPISIANISIDKWGSVVTACFLFLRGLRRIFARMILLSKDNTSKEEYAA